MPRERDRRGKPGLRTEMGVRAGGRMGTEEPMNHSTMTSFRWLLVGSLGLLGASCASSGHDEPAAAAGVAAGGSDTPSVSAGTPSASTADSSPSPSPGSAGAASGAGEAAQNG